MKKYLVFFSLIFIGSGVQSQPSIKVFGFEQESSPGTIAARIRDENGNPLKKAATQKNYFIYLSLNQKYSINPQHVFINGEAFAVEPAVIEKTPIAYVNNNIPAKPEQTIIVPKTADKVIELKIGDPVQVKKTPSLQKLTNKNHIVISYAWEKKNYFAVLKKLKRLDTVLNE